MGERIAFAEHLAAGFAPGGEYDLLWRQDLPAIRTAYRGLEIGPQMGLVPLGPDPASGLWEFANLATGTPPLRGEDGNLRLREDSGVVLVLLPGGSFWMGSQTTDPEGRNFVAQAFDDESPVHEVELSAFFMSKYELTQGQWLRSAGSNPSYHKPPDRLSPSLLSPVEQITWKAAFETLSRMGLVLPSEAQWEYAARAGTQTPWSLGAEREELRGKVNIADKTAADNGAQWGDIQDWPDNEDGGVIYVEIGRYPANSFGLHELHGNLCEWCLDHYDPNFYSKSPRRDPIAPDLGQPIRPRRGGGFDTAIGNTRSGFRDYESEEFGNYSIGVRPARPLD